MSYYCRNKQEYEMVKHTEMTKVADTRDNQITRVREIIKMRAPGMRLDRTARTVLSNWINGMGQRMGRSVRVWHSRRRGGSKKRIAVGDVMQGMQQIVSRDVYQKVENHLMRIKARVSV